MIIELFGLPASGKTFVARELKEKGFALIKINNRAELLWRGLLFYLCRPMLAAKLFFLILINSENYPRFYVKFMNGFLQTGAKFQKAGKFEAAVLDQGYFQNILTIFEKEKTPQELKRFAGILPRPDLLFVIEEKKEVRFSRIGSRGYQNAESFFEKYDTPEKIGEWEKITEKNFKTFKQLLPDLNLNYRVCSSSDDLESIFAGSSFKFLKR